MEDKILIIKDGSITSPCGFKASGIHGGLKKKKKDVALIFSECIAKASGTFTTNKVAAAPIIVSKKHIDNGQIQAIIINSGNANACTGTSGLANAYKMANITAQCLNIEKENVIVSSTGVIGLNLDMEKIESAIKKAHKELSYEDGHEAAKAILTTDTAIKEIAVEFHIKGNKIKIAAMAKGSGMIHPNMATMLCFVTSDVNISQELLDKAMKSSVDDTFNMVTVDGDTSTNDMAIIMANGLALNEQICTEDESYTEFYNALHYVLKTMAIDIASDGEGATKLITVNVLNTTTKKDARKVAKSIIQSSLVKTAIFGEDANWGRIIAAVGYSGVEFDESKVDIYFESNEGSIKVAENGESAMFDEIFAKKVLSGQQITINVDLKDGNECATAWGCDLTYDYVKINASYRS